MAEHVLLVDDEEKVLEFMSSFLQREGFHISTARTGIEALAIAKQTKPAVVVLDWMMPEMNGLDVCRELRKNSRVGIIMVTAKSDEVDKIIGLESGADDYMVKPFSLRELLARIRAVIRRLSDSPSAEDHLVRGDLIISSSEYRVWKQGEEVEMTPTEFKLLLTLAAKPGIVYSRLQLLNLAEAGQLHVNKVETDIADLAKQLCAAIEPLADEKDIKIHLEVLTPQTNLFVDPNRIRQVLLNLLTNAIRYTPNQGTIWIRMLNRDGQWLTIIVEDTGIGIAAEHLPHLDRFYRTDETRSRERGGSGLGLAIAKQYVISHQGTIKVESQENQGTRFTIQLPYASNSV